MKFRFTFGGRRQQLIKLVLLLLERGYKTRQFLGYQEVRRQRVQEDQDTDQLTIAAYRVIRFAKSRAVIALGSLKFCYPTLRVKELSSYGLQAIAQEIGDLLTCRKSLSSSLYTKKVERPYFSSTPVPMSS